MAKLNDFLVVTPIAKPMEGDDTIRAVTYWKWGTGLEESGHYVGRNYHYLEWGPEGSSGGVPDSTIRIVINMDEYDWLRDQVPKYRDSLNVWLRDFARDCRGAVAHEFGHSVGMTELPFNCETSLGPPPLMAPGCVDTLTGFRFADSTFSDTSKAEFSVKEER